MNEALTSYPQDKHLHWLAGWWLQLNQNQSGRAIVMFERVMQIDPRFADAWNEAAYCYAKQGNFDKAFADIKRYTELVPNEPNPQDSFAEISRMAGRFEDALTHYRQRAPEAERAHPTEEHFLPLLVAMGARQSTDRVKVLEGGIEYGMLSMDSFAWTGG